MKSMLATLLVAMVTLSGCGARQVQVETGAPAAAEVAVQVTNTATQPVNVYVVSAGTEMFVGQVPANSTRELGVSGVASGTNVTLRARTADGTRTYSRDNVALTGTYAWRVP